MKERPILFSAPMVRAINAGTKTQTRREVKYQPKAIDGPNFDGLWHFTKDPVTTHFACPYGRIGDKLAVKEAAWMWCEKRPNGLTKKGRPKWFYAPMKEAPVIYCVDHPKKPQTDIVSPNTGNEWCWKYKRGRFLPGWAVRTNLEIASIRVERLYDISDTDAEAEGVDPWHKGYGGIDYRNARLAFADLWNSINGPGSWAANPWVWVVTFKKL